MRLCPVWFLQGAIGSIGAIQNHERANVIIFLFCYVSQSWSSRVPHTWILLIKALTVKFMLSLSPLIQAWQRGQIQGHMLLLCLEIISSRPLRTWTQTDLSSPFRNETELMKNGCKCLVMVPFTFSGALFVWFLNFVLFCFFFAVVVVPNKTLIMLVQFKFHWVRFK